MESTIKYVQRTNHRAKMCNQMGKKIPFISVQWMWYEQYCPLEFLLIRKGSFIIFWKETIEGLNTEDSKKKKKK